MRNYVLPNRIRTGSIPLKKLRIMIIIGVTMLLGLIAFLFWAAYAYSSMSY